MHFHFLILAVSPSPYVCTRNSYGRDCSPVCPLSPGSPVSPISPVSPVSPVSSSQLSVVCSHGVGRVGGVGIGNKDLLATTSRGCAPMKPRPEGPVWSTGPRDDRGTRKQLNLRLAPIARSVDLLRSTEPLGVTVPARVLARASV